MDELLKLAEDFAKCMLAKQLRLVTAESCTGGWIAQTVTSIAGSSAWFDRGFVTYSNQAKIQMLGVQHGTLLEFGAVSEQTAIEMAAGALKHSNADVAVSVTGIAGPSGGSVDKPVGTVCFGCVGKNFTTTASMQQFSGDRTQVRRQAVSYALRELIRLIASEK